MVHKLEEIVGATKLFVFIITDKIFDSEWCRKGKTLVFFTIIYYTEFEAAVNKKPILVLKDKNYTLPDMASLPVEWQPHYPKLASHIIYSADMLKQCVQKIRDAIDKP